jgi:2-polyprenyl-3-methyl-5-hydroxy-6-metoxy-1,4-benzoquinol methylase
VARHLKKKHAFSGDLLEASSKQRSFLEKDGNFQESRIFSELDEVGASAYRLITAFDVLEHVPDPDKVLKDLHQSLQKGGHLILLLPYRPDTWGWDDDFYGHLRRWTLRGLIDHVEGAGFEVLKVLDPTFPVYSFLRQAMLRCFKRPHIEKNAQDNSLKSSRQNAWGDYPGWLRFFPWKYINRLSRLTQEFHRGDEICLLARKAESSLECQICQRASITYFQSLGHHVVHRCRHCGSQRVASGRREKHSLLRPVRWARDIKHVRDILLKVPEARSLLHLGCGRGFLLKEMQTLGWDVMGVEYSREDREGAWQSDFIKESIFEIPETKNFDLIVLQGILEFEEDLTVFFDRLEKHLTPRSRLMIEMVDFTRLSRRLLVSLKASMNVIPPYALCDQLGSRNISLFQKKSLSQGRLQLWFQRNC